ncbi:Hsp20/alpha crystallin family protein [Meiothermus granaticius]|uniref:18 kDa heat shock protein n=1 Tax=Meiothermus granaticius NBRC 107808 TaxID=1227551 RepID=A0A399F5U3_9DEIN|nr:Hsp20/alpha crystallin family protein [Meiothermus granaticius]MCL6528457.1 Hsp20/alpha crystallin family protein [Thermaceae bacterium]RIH91608.1 18 kDa heat shock protein [Meiothermus granaticius NBRC 107808]GEM88218.1 heat-shock protein Hsp20 [Meiothermus granaticius NBRC 107808]
MVRYDPFKEIEELQERMLRGFAPSRPDARTFAPPVDVMEDNSGLHLAVYLPGIEPEKVELTAENNTLSVKAERPFVKPEGASQYRLEGIYGSFVRSFTVPNTFDLSKVSANFKNGVLYIDLPKTEAAQPRKIEVRVNA